MDDENKDQAAVGKAVEDLAELADKCRALIELERYDEALNACNLALKLKPDDAAVWEIKGLALFNLGRHVEALAAYQNALDIEPNDARLWFNKGWVLINLNRFEEALEACKKAIEIRPDAAEAWYAKGWALLNLERHEEALAAYEKAEALYLELGNKYGLALTCGYQAFLLMTLGRHEEALELYRKEEALCTELGDKGSLQRCYANQALILEELGQPDEAMALLKKQEELCVELGDQESLQRSYASQRMNLRKWRRLDEELAFHAKQETLFLELGNKRSLGHCYRRWSELAREQKDRNTEREKLEAALQIFTELNMHGQITSVKSRLDNISRSTYEDSGWQRTYMARYIGLGKESDRVEFATFAPRSICPNSSFILDIWAYLSHQYSHIATIARELGRELELGRKIGVPVTKGAILSVRVDIEKLIVPDPVDTLVWDGEPANASFIIKVPADIAKGKYPGKAVISHQGVAIAKVVFLITIESLEVPDYLDHSAETTYPRSAFASYASENREEVLTRIQGMKKVAPDLDIFIDVFSLRSGWRWQKKLEQHVPAKDIFYLFWSRSAARSKWVEREWRLALSRRGLDYIDPVPLEEPDYVPPPKELSELHFSDAYISYIKYQNIKKQIHTQG